VFEYHMFYVLYPFVTYLLTLPHTVNYITNCIIIAELYIWRETETRVKYSTHNMTLECSITINLVDSPASGEGLRADCCEHSNEYLSSIKGGGEFLD
jgi:hypothetical protein